MGRSIKTKSQEYRRRKKNRGGERLKKWWELQRFHGPTNASDVQESEDNVTTCFQSEQDNMEWEVTEEASPSFQPLITTPEKQSNQPIQSLFGRRIVDIGFFLEEVRRLSNHTPFDCSFKDMEFQRETCHGLRSGFLLKCAMCNMSGVLWSEPDKPDNSQMDVNAAAVAGSMSIGSGFAGLRELLGAMDIRCMTAPTYNKYHAEVCDGWQEASIQAMREAAEDESRLATQRGDVDKDGTPLLTVVADASWAKRSYRNNYSSLSGVAAIVGYHTKKVVYIGVKNKFCMTCHRATISSNKDAKPHTCFKNWNDSSSSMEAAIIGDGFRLSEKMYGVRYARLIADGDSSVYKHLIESRPYPHLTVEKTECMNHLLRNYCSKIRDLATTALDYNNEKGEKCSTVTERKKIRGSIIRLRTAVTKAVQYRKSEARPINERVVDLKKDLLNSPSHVFGEHFKCSERNYFCNGPKPGEENLVPKLKASGLYAKIMTAVGYLVDNARSLMEEVNSNYAEHYNSIVAKFVGGKRINFSQKGSYQARCAAAVVSHNSNTPFYNLHKTMCKSSPGKFSKRYEMDRKRRAKLKFESRSKAPKSRKKLIISPNCSKTNNDPNYGQFAQKPDLDSEDLAFKTALFLEELKRSNEEIAKIQEETKMQNESHIWRELRRNLLTASNFAAVCKRLPYTSCEKLVCRLLYSTEIDMGSLKYGRENEVVAVEQLRASGMQVKECGLFIDKAQPFLAATPDGLLDEDGLVEIKCPSAAKNLTPDEAILQKRGKFYNFWNVKSGEIIGINKNHDYFYQMQGQLHVTQRKYCKFVIWTPKGMKVETIFRDDQFWKEKMETKLQLFYNNCLLPEILDPRKPRNMPIRNPQYIIEAMEKRLEKTNKNNK